MKETISKLKAGKQPFCLIQKQDDEDILVLLGDPLQLDKIDDIPRKQGKDNAGKKYDTISVIPFSQIKERGFQAKSHGEKILTLRVTQQGEISLDDLLEILSSEEITMEKEIQYDMDADTYAELIKNVVENEIGNGEGANFVIPRTIKGKIANFNVGHALSIFKSLLDHDYGTYWKFIFSNGSRYFVGSTPERHLEVTARKVRMNPISGTFRKEKHYGKRAYFKKDLLKFLTDPKEINELFMVVDEELKMMANMCGKGGAVVGPLLKEMSRLIHSEYLLAGESDKDIFELFKDSMFAATVTGSPVENACRIIYKYSKHSRGYYGSAMMLVGRDKEGNDFLDSPITIRTVDIDEDGSLTMAVGATLVRDSIPSQEVKETEAKSAALLNSILTSGQPKSEPPWLSKLANDDEIHETLQQRNQNLSNFWFFKQEASLELNVLFINLRITIIHNGDDFVFMLKHMFNSFGARTTVVPYTNYKIEQDPGAITVVGPGPGNPNQISDRKIKLNLDLVAKLLQTGKKSLYICLGHQLLCKSLGYSVIKKKKPFQGVQKKISLFGSKEIVGFYNTFAPSFDADVGDFEVSVDNQNNELLAIKSENFIGYQFHPESILTKNGDYILKNAVHSLLK